jgi:intermediate cleaving peptidase 55
MIRGSIRALRGSTLLGRLPTHIRPISFKSGQPLFETRPHLIAEGDLTPGISALEYFARRQRILNEIPDGSALIISGNRTQFATDSVFYEFRQDPNFYYLPGFLEPGAALVLVKDPGTAGKSIFFVPESDAHKELWDGSRTGTKGAVEFFNADEAHPVENMPKVISQILRSVKRVYADFPGKERFPKYFQQPTITGDPNLYNVLHDSSSSATELVSAIALIESHRLLKSEQEIDCMRTASEISAIVYNLAYQKKFATEHALHAFLDYHMKINGCELPAYLPVVAGGAHALTIHYTRNDDILRNGELVLVDAGGRFGGYCADISRTWPVNGTFSGPQKDLYQAVLNAQKQCIELCTVSEGYTLADIHVRSIKYLQSELINAGFKDLTERQLLTLYPHYIGHNLGLDVHDITTASRLDPLKAGQVITIEPGVYVPDSEEWPKHFRGIGIRIEDNVVIGRDSYEVLTVDALKEIHDIEQMVELEL